jgi:phosphoribosylglycinamide formyltransferase-1
MKNIVILISGSGSNMVAIINAANNQDWQSKFDARVKAVISNKHDASGLALAEELHIATRCINHTAFATREAFEAELMLSIDAYAPTLVILAGFMRILTPAFVAHYAGRLVNIHPSLLPKFTGLNTHQRAIDANCTVAGATVHMVTSELDMGPILAQVEVPILPNDTAEILAARVQIQEHLIYPRAIAKLLMSA